MGRSPDEYVLDVQQQQSDCCGSCGCSDQQKTDPVAEAGIDSAWQELLAGNCAHTRTKQPWFGRLISRSTPITRNVIEKVVPELPGWSRMTTPTLGVYSVIAREFVAEFCRQHRVTIIRITNLDPDATRRQDMSYQVGYAVIFANNDTGDIYLGCARLPNDALTNKRGPSKKNIVIWEAIKTAEPVYAMASQVAYKTNTQLAVFKAAAEELRKPAAEFIEAYCSQANPETIDSITKTFNQSVDHILSKHPQSLRTGAALTRVLALLGELTSLDLTTALVEVLRRNNEQQSASSPVPTNVGKLNLLAQLPDIGRSAIVEMLELVELYPYDVTQMTDKQLRQQHKWLKQLPNYNKTVKQCKSVGLYPDDSELADFPTEKIKVLKDFELLNYIDIYRAVSMTVVDNVFRQISAELNYDKFLILFKTLLETYRQAVSTGRMPPELQPNETTSTQEVVGQPTT